MEQTQSWVVSSLESGEEIRTDIVLTVYANKVFVLITQLQKVGTLISSWYEQKDSFEAGYTFYTQVMLGKRDDPLLEVYARNLCENLCINTSKDLLLGICLLENGRDPVVFRDVIAKLIEMKTW